MPWFQQTGQGWLAYVKWKGFGDDYNSWERVTSIPDVIVERFRRQNNMAEVVHGSRPAIPEGIKRDENNTASSSNTSQVGH